VAEHVIPLLNRMAPTILPDGVSYTSRGWIKVLRQSLRAYLRPREGAIIYGDWPADFQHLMAIMSGSALHEPWLIDIGMRLLPKSDPKPLIPHNALSDAIALMEWHKLHG
jgi:hypothetical protein